MACRLGRGPSRPRLGGAAGRAPFSRRHAIHGKLTINALAFDPSHGPRPCPERRFAMARKRLTATVLAALLAGSGAVAAQDFVFGWNPRTGDVWIDQTLGDINDYGYRYRDSFVDELVRYYDAPRDYVTMLLADQRWAPGDVYYSCAIGDIVGRSCRYVAEEW